MEILWAPWRMEYILQLKQQGCIFCDKPKETRDRENLILHRGQKCFVIMNYYPYNNGHLMVVPYQHQAELERLDEKTRVEMMELVTRSAAILKKSYRAQGINIGMNLGRIAGAGIDEHLHFHIVPRWEGDTNFMPVTGHTKVSAQGLYEAWETLAPCFKEMDVPALKK
jgi:ATP adenylyltransferase